ncbi:hypothetical protein BDN70DRAFT_898117 [Pholiota conissans]|uniref:Uncharacterized protein n=1 Tax=Pholiota conissans TaxID=109636 RepID=A0A9P5YU47_9AGAR|nr:hypothetical protein BDN70DRAFT_898117 [Pholiota conissans]
MSKYLHHENLRHSKHNQLDPTFPDNIFGSVQWHLPGYLPLAPPTTDAETLLQNVEELAVSFEDLLGYNFEASYLASEAASQSTEIHSNSLPVSINGESHGVQLQDQGQGQGLGANLAATSTTTDLTTTQVAQNHAPDPEIQRSFLQFLVENHNLLQSLPDSSQHSISRIREAFEQNIPVNHLQLVSNPSADLDMMIRRFKPKVATSAIRQESDSRKKNKSEESSTGRFTKRIEDEKAYCRWNEETNALPATAKFVIHERPAEKRQLMSLLLQWSRTQMGGCDDEICHATRTMDGMRAMGGGRRIQSHRVIELKRHRVGCVHPGAGCAYIAHNAVTLGLRIGGREKWTERRVSVIYAESDFVKRRGRERWKGAQWDRSRQEGAPQQWVTEGRTHRGGVPRGLADWHHLMTEGRIKR